MRERLRRDVFLNVGLSVVSAVATLALVRYAGHAYAPAALGLFLLSRRFADSFSNLFQVGTPYALRRYLAQEATRASQVRAALLSGALTVMLGGLALGLIRIRPSAFAGLLFDGSAPADLLDVTIVLTTALALTNIAVSIMVARQRYGWANLINIMNPSGWLLACFAFSGAQGAAVVPLLLRGSLLCIGTSVVVPLWVWAREPRVRGVAVAAKAVSVREFMAFALPRTLAPFAETLLFTAAAWLLRDRPDEAGYLLVAFTILRSANVALQPVGAVAGVAAVQLQDRAQVATVRRGVNLLLGSTLYLGIVMTCLGTPWVGLLLRAWLANPSLAAAALLYSTALLLALPAYILYQGMKQVIDMLWQSPLNLYTSIAAIGVLFAAFGVAGGSLDLGPRVVVASVAGLGVTGILTLWWVRSLVEPASYFGVARLVPASLTLGAANLVLARAASGWPVAAQFGLATVAGLASLGALTLLLARFRPAAFVVEASDFLWRRRLRTPGVEGAP